MQSILAATPGGAAVIAEYKIQKQLTETTRKVLVNIAVADMMDKYG